ncbi:aminotransferase [Thioclava sp. SK-1]|uniref:DegT/DnrJ/EryC1/StrS family aminotransferase n=1 Tax=Thioclava sp. SK-1 TaxID=1889770 RepID=UPI000826F81B|nr:aminotransferase class I/II-fold pyridoxal phosphate-dependent enzyme [Thioclava sp. SK-1]OCX62786.1 aminotransferase [Thioclava sp. SK-1]
MPRDTQIAPNCYDAEPIPVAAKAEIDRLLATGDLFRYTSENAPVSLLEAEFAALMGQRFAVAVSSCSQALFLSLKALNLPRGANVLVPAFTFAAVPSAILHADCTPVLVEVKDDYRIDIEDLHHKIDDQTGAILISHMRGHTSDMDAILAVAHERNIPVVEDAAHSLGTLWNGKKIGTLGTIGCFSFQSYKMLNAGEGGILITNDADLAARTIIMSGAYEHNWRKHPGLEGSVLEWQNKLPLYNCRMQNLSAAVIRPQLSQLDRRVENGRRNHDYVANQLNSSDYITVPAPLPAELRAPDSLQFNLKGEWTDSQVQKLQAECKANGVNICVFGLSQDNARAFWNWQFLPKQPDLPRTRAMLMRACDTRLPARLTQPDLDFISQAILEAVQTIKGEQLHLA